MLAPTEDVEGDEEVRIEEEESDDTGVPRPAPRPGDPSQCQVEEHRQTHWPYRSWCKWCVLGRGRGRPRTTTNKSDIPVVGIDYFFITKGGSIKTKTEVEDAEAMEEKRQKGEAVKCIEVRCSYSACVFAHIVPRKGVDEDNIVVDMILNDLDSLGKRGSY